MNRSAAEIDRPEGGPARGERSEANPTGATRPEVSRGHSSRENEPGAGKRPFKRQTGGLPALRSGHASKWFPPPETSWKEAGKPAARSAR